MLSDKNSFPSPLQHYFIVNNHKHILIGLVYLTYHSSVRLSLEKILRTYCGTFFFLNSIWHNENKK